MNAIEDLERILDLATPTERRTEFEIWRKRWLLGCERMERVRKADVEKAGPAAYAVVAKRMKDVIFTHIGMDKSLMFHLVRPVGDLFEFRLALTVLRPVPKDPDEAEERRIVDPSGA
jgi:hypothetical protein